MFVFVYGQHTIADRRSIWAELSLIGSNLMDPFIIIGDYNVVNKSTDRVNGVSASEAETQDLASFIMCA